MAWTGAELLEIKASFEASSLKAEIDTQLAGEVSNTVVINVPLAALERSFNKAIDAPDKIAQIIAFLPAQYGWNVKFYPLNDILEIRE